MAAIRARKAWLDSAWTDKRQGKQVPPADEDWEIVLFRAGRGFGKTMAENEWLWWEMWSYPDLVGHVVAPTQADVRGTSFEGNAGLCSIVPAECLHRGTLDKAYNKSTHELKLSNGSVIRGFSATENGSRLRGPQCHALVGDEIAAWDAPSGNLELALTNALLGLRLPYPDGRAARAVLGTTPRPIPFLKRLEKRKGVRVITGTSYENLANLSASFRNQLLMLAGTQAGRQEIEAAYIDEEGASSIFRRSWVNLWPANKPLPTFNFIIESYDAASSEENYDAKKQMTDPTASVILGVFNAEAAFTAEERRRMSVRSRYAALVLDAWDERLGLPDLLEKARSQNRIKWGEAPGRKSDIVLIEDKSSGIAMRQMMVRWGIPTWPYNPGRQNKTQRAHAVAPLVKQGMLFVPESANPDRKGLTRDWCEPFLEQLFAFSGPGSVEHDDYIDALTQAMQYLSDRGLLEAKPDETVIDVEEKRALDMEVAEREYEAERAINRKNPYGG